MNLARPATADDQTFHQIPGNCRFSQQATFWMLILRQFSAIFQFTSSMANTLPFGKRIDESRGKQTI